MLRAIWGLVVVFGVCLTLSCSSEDNSTDGGDSSSDGAGNGADLGEADGDIAITIGSGTTPTYRWSGGAVVDLTVIRPETYDIVWGIMEGTSAISSPVTHGTVPSGATSFSSTYDTEELELTSGVEYLISVIRSNGTFGSQAFTP